MEESFYQNPPHWVIQSNHERFEKIRSIALREFKYSLYCPRKEKPLDWSELEWREYLIHWGYLIGTKHYE